MSWNDSHEAIKKLAEQELKPYSIEVDDKTRLWTDTSATIYTKSFPMAGKREVIAWLLSKGWMIWTMDYIGIRMVVMCKDYIIGDDTNA